MQRRMLSLLAVCCTAVVGVAAAQAPSARFGLGGGVTIPTGNYKTTDKVGWHALGVVQFGATTCVPSIVTGIPGERLPGFNEDGYAEMYLDNISFVGPRSNVQKDSNPQTLFRRLVMCSSLMPGERRRLCSQCSCMSSA